MKSGEIFSVSQSLRVFPLVKMRLSCEDGQDVGQRAEAICGLWTSREAFLAMLRLWIPTQLEAGIKVKETSDRQRE